jgi:hypothetical protein
VGLWGLPLYDEAVHTYSGFAASAVFGCMLARRPRWRPDRNWWWFAIAVVSFGLAAGVVWEVLEWFVIDIQAVDTVIDVIADSIGTAVAVGFVSWAVAAESPGRRWRTG